MSSNELRTQTSIRPTPAGTAPLQDLSSPGPSTACVSSRPACPVCGGPLFDQRAKLICARCHTVCETCCEGGPG